jgi:DNA-binding HxlR family transcriptional regulator
MPRHSERIHTARRARRSPCPVSCTLDVIGDRWTLLVIRDLMQGKKRFGEFLDSPEKIPTNTLANRLKWLMSLGVIASRRYNDRPVRLEYALTPKGEDLRPVLRAMVDWGVRHAGGRIPSSTPPRNAREAQNPVRRHRS